MKPFNLELAKQGHPICTRDGRNVRSICFDRGHATYPIVGLYIFGGVECVGEWTIDGHYHFEAGLLSDLDLFMKSKTEKRWMFISSEEIAQGRVCATNLCTYRPKAHMDGIQVIEFEVEV